MDEIQQKLRRMVEKEGIEVVTLAGMCDMMLKKYLPDHPEAVRALALCVDRGVAQQIRKTPNAMAREMLLPNWLQLLADTGLSQDQSRWVIDSWADAIDGVPDTRIVNPYDDTTKKKSDDLDAALLFVLLAGLAFHVLVFLGFSFVVELYVDPKKVHVAMKDVLLFYSTFLPISAALTFIVFVCMTAMYGQESVSLDRYLRNYICLFSFATAAFMFAMLLNAFIGILIVSIFLAAGSTSWLLRFYGFRVFIITSIMHLTQYVVYFVMVTVGVILALHQNLAADPETDLQENLKQLEKKIQERRGGAQRFRPDAEQQIGAACWTDQLLRSAPPPPELIAHLFQKREHLGL